MRISKFFMLFSLALMITAQSVYSPAASAQEKIGLDMGITYQSDYFWRGFSFYGYGANANADATRGVFFPWLGYAFSDFYLYVGGEVAEGLVGDDPVDMEKDWNGIDFILTGSKGIMDDAIKLGIKLSYFYYPRSRKDDWGNGNANDFYEVAPSITFAKLPLSPKLLVSWYGRIEEQFDGQETMKDTYFQLSFGESIELVKGASLYLGAWGSYFYYASYETAEGDPRQGFSDIGAMAKISVSASAGVSFSASYNFAYTPDKDFYEANGYEDKYHNWTTFGVTYSI